MNLDLLFISSILYEKDGKAFRDAVKKVPLKLLNGTEKDVYKFIREYFRESNGRFPSALAVTKKFPDIELQKPKDTLIFYASELNSREKYNLLTKGSSLLQNKLLSKDIDGALSELKKINTALGGLGISEASTVQNSMKLRVEEYVKNKKTGGHIGYLTGIDAIDNHIGGLETEYLVIMAKTGIGKTFLSLMISKNIWFQANAPVFVVSNEMSVKKLGGRMDSVVGEFSYSKYRKGLLSREEEKRLKGVVEKYKTLPPLYITSGAGKSVEDIEFEIMSVDPKPCLILVDGLYLTDMGAKDEFQNTAKASRAYQRLKSKLNIPLIATTQMTDDGQTKYARAIQEDADMVLFMFRSINMKDSDQMGIKFTKIRDEDSDLSVRLRWDFENWIFRQLDEDEVIDPDAEKEHE